MHMKKHYRDSMERIHMVWPVMILKSAGTKVTVMSLDSPMTKISCPPAF